MQTMIDPYEIAPPFGQAAPLAPPDAPYASEPRAPMETISVEIEVDCDAPPVDRSSWPDAPSDAASRIRLWCSED